MCDSERRMATFKLCPTMMICYFFFWAFYDTFDTQNEMIYEIQREEFNCKMVRPSIGDMSWCVRVIEQIGVASSYILLKDLVRKESVTFNCVSSRPLQGFFVYKNETKMVSRWTTKVWRNVRTLHMRVSSMVTISYVYPWYLRFSWARRATVIVSTGDTLRQQTMTTHYLRARLATRIHFLDKIQSIGIIVGKRVLRLEFSETLSRAHIPTTISTTIANTISRMVLPSSIWSAESEVVVVDVCVPFCAIIMYRRIMLLFFFPIESIEKEAKR